MCNDKIEIIIPSINKQKNKIIFILVLVLILLIVLENAKGFLWTLWKLYSLTENELLTYRYKTQFILHKKKFKCNTNNELNIDVKTQIVETDIKVSVLSVFISIRFLKMYTLMIMLCFLQKFDILLILNMWTD